MASNVYLPGKRSSRREFSRNPLIVGVRQQVDGNRGPREPRMRGLIAGAGLFLAAAAAINKMLVLKAGGIESRLAGRTRFYHWRYKEEIHNIFYKSIGGGPPILLIHSIHAAASSFEMRKIHSALADQFTVYTLDLLGFGLSDRPALHYDAELYIALIHDFIRDVIGESASVLACSLSAAHAIENAARHPEQFETLVLVAAYGTGARDRPRGHDRPADVLDLSDSDRRQQPVQLADGHARRSNGGSRRKYT